MTTPIIICDDSSLARKQMARALPEGWDAEITFAKDGVEGLEALKSGKGEILFLDLNMPVMDGYQLLEALRGTDLNPMVIVVSGDVQPEAYNRVLELGAREFIKKPVDKTVIANILQKYDIQDKGAQGISRRRQIELHVDVRDGCKEIANVAMGRAADLLARLLDVFVLMPIPNVNMIETSELRMTLDHIGAGEAVSSVCQGFIGSGIAGEALLIFNESSFNDIAALMKYDGKIDDAVELELLMDVASILIGACLKGIADQLDINFSQGHPIVLGHHVQIGDLVKRNAGRWKKTLAIEMCYKFENHNINCDLLLLFTEDSMESLNRLVSYLSD
jgi:chemotaxis protein CheY-P-specific phosphatase CheC